MVQDDGISMRTAPRWRARHMDWWWHHSRSRGWQDPETLASQLKCQPIVNVQLALSFGMRHHGL